MLRAERDGPVLRLTLDRPEVRNAFNDDLIARLTEAVTRAAHDVRAIVLAGEGPAFCAGGDLEWMRKAAGYTHEQNVADAIKLAGLFQAISRCRPIVVARVQGAAFGGGCGLVAAADVAVAAEGTKFAFSEARLGLIPGTISGFVVPKIGPGHARALFTTAEAFEADHALRIGLVHQVVPADQLDAAIEAKIKAVLSVGPEAAYLSKVIAQESPLPLEETARRLADARASEEGREGVAAFLEKRKAAFVVER